jgi:hypothetical protein
MPSAPPEVRRRLHRRPTPNPAFAPQTCRNRQCAADALIQRCGSTAIGKGPRREAALGDGSPASRRLQHWPLFQPSSGTHRHSSFIDRTFGETAEVKVIGRLPGERSCLSVMWTCSTGPATLARPDHDPGGLRPLQDLCCTVPPATCREGGNRPGSHRSRLAYGDPATRAGYTARQVPLLLTRS